LFAIANHSTFACVNSKPLPRNFATIALLTTPLLAFFVISPALRFGGDRISHFTTGFILQLILIAFTWWINFILYRHLSHRWMTWLASFAAVLLVHFFVLQLSLLLPKDSMTDTSKMLPWPGIVVINAIVLVITHNQFIAAERERTQLELERLKQASLLAQKQALTQQLNPHFLFNALSVLKALIDEDPDSAKNYVVKLSDFLRYAIEAGSRELVSVKSEVEFAKGYLAIQQLRFSTGLLVTWNIDKAMEQKWLPAFALHTLTENAVKHNWFSVEKPLHLRISASGHELRVTNNKQLKTQVQSTGIGLKNLHERYSMLTSQTMHVNDGPVEFEVTIPVIEK
jgi:sensor histidine kinase YesM